MTITRDAAARKILAAHETGRLSAQAPHPLGSYHLVREGRTYACAIGQLLPAGVGERLETRDDGYALAGELIQQGTLRVDPADEDWFVAAQVLHDNWVIARRREFNSVGDESEKQFLTHVRSGLTDQPEAAESTESTTELVR